MNQLRFFFMGWSQILLGKSLLCGSFLLLILKPFSLAHAAVNTSSVVINKPRPANADSSVFTPLSQGVIEEVVQKVHAHLFVGFSQQNPPHLRDPNCQQGEPILNYKEWLFKGSQTQVISDEISNDISDEISDKISDEAKERLRPCATESVRVARSTLAQWLVFKPRELIEGHKDISRLMGAPEFLLDQGLLGLKKLLREVLSAPLSFAVVKTSILEQNCLKFAANDRDCVAADRRLVIGLQLVPEVITQLERINMAEKAKDLRDFASAEYLVNWESDSAISRIRLTDIKFKGQAQVAAALARSGSGSTKVAWGLSASTASQ